MHREDTWDSEKNEVHDNFDRDAWCFFEKNYLPMMERYAYHQSRFVILGTSDMAKDRNIALFDLERLKQLETMRKYWSINLIMKACLETLETLGHFRLKYSGPGSSPIQKYGGEKSLPLTLLWWIEAKCSNNKPARVSFGLVFDEGGGYLLNEAQYLIT